MLSILPKNVVISSYARTPIGSYLGSLATLSASDLGAAAIKQAVDRSRLGPEDINGVCFGHVLSAGCGQNPTRQAALKAGLPASTDVFTIQKVCASGLKSAIIASQNIALFKDEPTYIVGGMESMSNVPYAMPQTVRKSGFGLGDKNIKDLLISDGLWDVYNNIHMGTCTEELSKEYQISRREQDEYAIESYSRSAIAWNKGLYDREVIPIDFQVKNKTNERIFNDEEYSKLNLDKVSKLSPVFLPDGGTITAANSSKLSDGAAALVLSDEEYARERNMPILAKIISFADYAIDPIKFGIAPAFAIRKALNKVKLNINNVDYFEINEAFSAVAIANIKELNIDHSRVNVDGGAVSLGHPIGASGARILGKLAMVLHQRGGQIGVASICNGGGGATAVVIEVAS